MFDRDNKGWRNLWRGEIILAVNDALPEAESKAPGDLEWPKSVIRRVMASREISDTEIGQFVAQNGKDGDLVGGSGWNYTSLLVREAKKAGREELLYILGRLPMTRVREQVYINAGSETFQKLVNDLLTAEPYNVYWAIKRRIEELEALDLSKGMIDVAVVSFFESYGKERALELAKDVGGVSEEAVQRLLQHPDRRVRLEGLEMISERLDLRGGVSSPAPPS